MPETLFEAPPYDPARERRRKRLIIGALLVVLLGGFLLWWFRYWPETRAVERFFQALEQEDFERAYAVWMADPEWKQHPEKYERYPFPQFYLDWGPGSTWGAIRSHKIEGARPPRGSRTGVVVVVTVNDRVDPKARIWVDKSDKSLSFSPY